MKSLIVLSFLSLISIAACRGYTGSTGATGSTGPQGVQGVAGQDATVHITVYGSTTCTSLGNGFYGKAVSNNYQVFSTSNNTNASKCTGNNVNMGLSYSDLWLNTDLLAVFVLPNSIKVIDFN